jgi:hypothetical protein
MNEQSISALSQKMSVKEIIKTILDQHFPSLFSLLTSIHNELQDLIPEQDTNLLLSLQAKMNEELDEIYRREKLVLFPYLIQLEAENKVSESCKPFKTVKNHFGNLLAATNQLLSLLYHKSHDPEAADDYIKIALVVERFKQRLILSQDLKEQSLIGRFSDCNRGCKTI